MRTLVNNKLSFLLVLLIVLYAWHTAVPYIGFNMPAVLNTLILVLLFVFMFQKETFHVSSAVVSILPLFLLSVLEFASYSFSQWTAQIYGLVQRMVFPLLMLFLMQNGTSAEKRRILMLVLAGYVVTCITTYFGCLSNPGAARLLATMSEEEPELFNMYRQLNIGSFAFVYTVVLLLPIILYVIRNRGRFYVLFTFFAVVAVAAIYETEYTTALLMMLSVLLLFFLPQYFTVKDLKKKIWVILILVAFVWWALPDILDSIIPYIDSETMSSRLEDLSATVRGDVVDTQDTDIESRSELFMKSINGFLSSPIWGTFNKAGGHSFLFDTMSKYGLIGLALLFVMYKRVYTLFIHPYHSMPYYGYLLFVFLMTLVLAVLNPKDNLLVLTFLIPLFAEAYFDDIKTN